MQVTDAEVKRIYANRFTPRENIARDRIWQVLVREFFQRWIGEKDTVVDLGCGYGEFLRHVRCGKAIGVDLNPDSARAFAGTSIEFRQGSVCELTSIGDGTVDFVFTSNLMEHLPDKRAVERMIAEAFRVLKPGGSFVMMGPNINVIPGPYWDFWDHVVAISDVSLAEALVNLGFDIALCKARFLPYTTKSAIPKAPWLVSVYLKCPWVWRLMGHQFLIRACKPARG